MNPRLTFETRKVRGSALGQESSVPDLLAGLVLQNKVNFQLGEYDEIFEGYGTHITSYPYRQQNCYTRELALQTVKFAVLENDFLRAEFLPELGGRLWSLVDKTTGKNLLYTNDVIRYSNLATCNAWFSGGVEWNSGIIGHTPFTCRPLYCAELESEQGWPILRLYEYERIRGIYYQIDFWLRPDSQALNCRMRVVNDGDQVIPMYWWSNIAAPEYKNGRIVTPSSEAYTYWQSSDGQGNVRKVDVPMVDGMDISQYENIPKQVDYFFELNEEEPRFIANIDEEGFGLLHLSTNRLISRKLFSWGNNPGSDRWQDFLTEDGGRYIELQAGLGKTQYGCVPLAPHTTWEWMEQYGAVQLQAGADNMSLCKQASEIAEKQKTSEELEETLIRTRRMAKTEGELLLTGNEYSAFSTGLRPQNNPRAGAEHLEFGASEGPFLLWEEFMETGTLHRPDPQQAPDAFFCEEKVFEQLENTIETKNLDNWYAHYQLGVMQLSRGEDTKAQELLKESNKLNKNAWALHALACISLKGEDKQAAAQYILQGCHMQKQDLSYVKETLRILLRAEAYNEVLSLQATFSPEIAKDLRVRYSYVTALYELYQYEEAFALLNENGGLIPDDVREGDDAMERIWEDMHQNLYGKFQRAPQQFRFRSL